MASIVLPDITAHIATTADVDAPSGVKRTLPALVVRLTSDAEVKLTQPEPKWTAVIVDANGTRQAAGSLHDARISTISKAINEPESWTVDLSPASAAASLIDLADPLPELEVQVYRGAELVAWGPITDDGPNDEAADSRTITLTCKGAFELLRRRRFGDANAINLLANPLFARGFEDWILLRTRVVSDIPGFQAVAGKITLVAQPPKRLPSNYRYVHFDSFNSTDETAAGTDVGTDTLQLIQDIQITAPGNRDIEVAATAWWYLPSNTWFEKKVDSSAITIARLPLWTSPPFGYFTDSEEVFRTDWPDPLPRDRWFETTATITVPAGQTKLVHAAFVGPGGISYMTLPQMIPDLGLDFDDDDVATVVTGIVTHSQDSTFSKTDCNIDSVAAPTGQIIDRSYPYRDHESCGDALNQLAADGYGDWTMLYTPTHRYLGWSWPRRGGYKPSCKIWMTAAGSNVVKVERTRNWSSGATTVIAQGNGGFYRAESQASLVAPSVTLEEVFVAPETVEPWGLPALAREQLAVLSQPLSLTVTCPPSAVWITAAFDVGDWTDVLVQQTEMTVSGQWRCTAKDIDPDTDTAVLTLVPLTAPVRT